MTTVSVTFPVSGFDPEELADTFLQISRAQREIFAMLPYQIRDDPQDHLPTDEEPMLKLRALVQLIDQLSESIRDKITLPNFVNRKVLDELKRTAANDVRRLQDDNRPIVVRPAVPIKVHPAAPIHVQYPGRPLPRRPENPS